jgi:hypothetical protein
MEDPPSQKPRRKVEDLLWQLLTVTAGVLIALSLEGAVEWSHQRTMVSEAKDNLRQEMLNNKREIERTLASLPKLKINLQAAVLFIGDLQAHRANGQGTVKLDYTYYSGLLSAKSWSAAQAAGTLAHMPYGDIRKYAEIYDTQQRVDAVQERLAEAVAAAVPSNDIDNSNPRELRDWERRVQASLTYLQKVDGLARGLKSDYEEALR